MAASIFLFHSGALAEGRVVSVWICYGVRLFQMLLDCTYFNENIIRNNPESRTLLIHIVLWMGLLSAEFILLSLFYHTRARTDTRTYTNP